MKNKKQQEKTEDREFIEIPIREDTKNILEKARNTFYLNEGVYFSFDTIIYVAVKKELEKLKVFYEGVNKEDGKKS